MIISDLICFFLERHKGIKKINFRIRNGGFLFRRIGPEETNKKAIGKYQRLLSYDLAFMNVRIYFLNDMI